MAFGKLVYYLTNQYALILLGKYPMSRLNFEILANTFSEKDVNFPSEIEREAARR